VRFVEVSITRGAEAEWRHVTGWHDDVSGLRHKPVIYHRVGKTHTEMCLINKLDVKLTTKGHSWFIDSRHRCVFSFHTS